MNIEINTKDKINIPADYISSIEKEFIIIKEYPVLRVLMKYWCYRIAYRIYFL